MSLYDDVWHFNKKMGLPSAEEGASPSPHLLDLELWRMRREFLEEELREMAECYEASDLAGVADAIADSLYVLVGTAVMMELPLDRIWREVHAANMRKVRAEDGQTDGGSGRPHALGVRKPEGWQPPDVEKIIEACRRPIASDWSDVDDPEARYL